MKKFISLFICLIMLCGVISVAASAESGHNHKYYIDYISRSADQSKVESFGLFCEECDEVVHIKTEGIVVDYNIYYNGWGADGKTTWYFIDGLVTLKEPVRISGTVNIVLLDNAFLICESGIRIFENGTLNIYSQHLDYSPESRENTMGKLRSYVRDENSDAAAIGGLWDAENVAVNIYGGDIYAYSAGNGAAIGSGMRGSAVVNIYGGKVRADSVDSGAAIGGGYDYATAEVSFYGGIVWASSQSKCKSASIGKGLWECHSTVNYYGGYVYGEPQKSEFYTTPGIDADSIKKVDGAGKIGNIDGFYDEEGLALAKQAGWTDNSGFPVGSVLSDGSIWIIIAVAVIVIVGIAALVIIKNKKKSAIAGGKDESNS